LSAGKEDFMRDYSFGNFLRRLRLRRGLSQFQLGRLVGVSDKAVSKWENGSAKPQSRILYQLGRVLGVTVEFEEDFTRRVIEQSAPVSISDLIQIPGLCHSVGVWEENGQALVKSGVPISRLVAYRDDVFRAVQEKMKPEMGQGTGYAFRIMEDVRQGRYAKTGIPAEVRQQLLALGVQEWLIESLGKIQYLFPKAHGVLHVKHAMILMWYRINYPEAFERIVIKEMI